MKAFNLGYCSQGPGTLSMARALPHPAPNPWTEPWQKLMDHLKLFILYCAGPSQVCKLYLHLIYHIVLISFQPLSFIHPNSGFDWDGGDMAVFRLCFIVSYNIFSYISIITFSFIYIIPHFWVTEQMRGREALDGELEIMLNYDKVMEEGFKSDMFIRSTFKQLLILNHPY